jgi:regulator of RNase E activity RraA
MQRRAGGIVSDGSVRDSGQLHEYGIPIFAHGCTAKQGPAAMWPWRVNDEISCGGILVGFF